MADSFVHQKIQANTKKNELTSAKNAAGEWVVGVLKDADLGWKSGVLKL